MTREDLFPIFVALGQEVNQAWLEGFDGPPPFDPTDWLDGDALTFLLGKDFSEIVPLGLTPMADTPLLSLLPLEAACYYMGTHLLDVLAGWERFPRRLPAPDGFVAPWLPGISYFSLLGHLRLPVTREWLRKQPACERSVGRVLAFLCGPIAAIFPEQYFDDELEELKLVAQGYPV